MNSPAILFVANWWYPRSEDPILGLFVRKHAEALAAHCDLVVLHINDRLSSAARRFVCTEAMEDGLLTIRASYRRPQSRVPLWHQVLTQLRYLTVFKHGFGAARAHLPALDVVHVNLLPPPVFLLARSRLFANTPYVLTEHASDFLPGRGTGRRTLHTAVARRLTARAAAVTTPSEALAKGMKERGLTGRYHVVHNVVDTSIFTPATRAETQAKTHFIHVSGLTTAKNVSGMLDAMRLLRERRQDVSLEIIGDGPHRAALEESARSLGLLGSAVVFSGHRSVPEVANSMRRAAALVLFSDFENSPCVIAEAAACGVPVIATRTGGIPEIVTRSTGILVEVGDVQGITEAMLAVADGRESFDPRSIRRHALENFAYDAVAAAFLEIYHSAAATPRIG